MLTIALLLQLGHFPNWRPPRYSPSAARPAHLLNDFGQELDSASPIRREQFYRTVLDKAFVKNRKIVAIRPKPNYYDLLLFVCSFI